MMRFTLMSAAAISAVSASVSTSVFPNSLCQGASDSLGGLVGVGKVTLANGEVEVHCGCPSVSLSPRATSELPQNRSIATGKNRRVACFVD